MAESGDSSGPSTDRHNDPVVDPSKNVLDTVDREVARLDDVANIRAFYVDRLGDLRAQHTEKLAQLRQEHVEKMQVKETERLDAIRSVAAASAREQAAAAETRAATLAGQVQAAAEAARTTVDAARVSAAENQAAALAPMQEALAAVQRFQYEAVGGKTQVTETQAKGGNTALWIGLAVAGVGLMFTALLFLVAIAGLAVTLLVGP